MGNLVLRRNLKPLPRTVTFRDLQIGAAFRMSPAGADFRISSAGAVYIKIGEVGMISAVGDFSYSVGSMWNAETIVTRVPNEEVPKRLLRYWHELERDRVQQFIL